MLNSSSSSSDATYIYDGANAFELISTASQSVLQRYTYSLGVDEPLALVSNTGTVYPLLDALGSILSLANSSGTLADTFAYSQNGWGTPSHTGSTSLSLRFTSRDYDGSSALYYLRARYYDPATGRFISEDPIRFNGGIDFYSYVADNPVMNDDPDGLRTQVCCRPLRGRLGNLSGQSHCYVLITSEDDQLLANTYGLHREHPDNSPYPQGATPVQNDPTDVGGTCTDVPGSTPCKEQQFVHNAVSNTNCPSCGHGGYFLYPTNSNFWVYNTLQGSGMTPPTLPNGISAPGYSNAGLYFLVLRALLGR